jgi:hypothetical protein
MNPVKTKGNRPEDLIVTQLKSFLKTRDWLVKKTHGNEYQSGFPDLFCYHKRYGLRWIEVKVSKTGHLQGSQIEFFRELAAVGCGVWILTAANDAQYQLLFKEPNWIWFLPGMGMKHLL